MVRLSKEVNLWISSSIALVHGTFVQPSLIFIRACVGELFQPVTPAVHACISHVIIILLGLINWA